MNKFLTCFLLITITLSAKAQSFNQEKLSMINYLKRLYNSAPFEGVKIIEDYDHKYLVSVLTLDKTKFINSSVLNRVAQMKAQSQANNYLNGSTISTDIVIKTIEQKEGDKTSTVVQSIESIKEDSLGFILGMELLSNFDDATPNRVVFIFYREIQPPIK